MPPTPEILSFLMCVASATKQTGAFLHVALPFIVLTRPASVQASHAACVGFSHDFSTLVSPKVAVWGTCACLKHIIAAAYLLLA